MKKRKQIKPPNGMGFGSFDKSSGLHIATHLNGEVTLVSTAMYLRLTLSDLKVFVDTFTKLYEWKKSFSKEVGE